MKWLVLKKVVCNICITLSLLALSNTALAATDLTIGGMASIITQSFANLTKLITASSYVAGIAFCMSAVMKFKQHKDNPTQIPVGTPIAMLFIASSLLFLPTVLGITGQTMFGSGATTAGPLGTVF